MDKSEEVEEMGKKTLSGKKTRLKGRRKMSLQIEMPVIKDLN